MMRRGSTRFAPLTAMLSVVPVLFLLSCMVSQVMAAGNELLPYQRVESLQGEVKAVGSSTVASLLKQATDVFQGLQPNVNVDITGAGSASALEGMLASPATLGLLSRPLNAREREALQARYGQPPAEMKIAVDAVAVYVFKSNPIKAMDLDQLRRVFGRDPDAASSWGELGLAGEWAEMPLERYGMERGRGAHELIRELVLRGRDFAVDMTTEPVSTSVVQGVAAQPGGIGYASVYFRTQRTRVMPVLVQGQALEPSAENAASGRYPLARHLYVVVNQPQSLPMPARQFLSFVLSRDGQEMVSRQGMYALDAAGARASLALLGVVPAATGQASGQ